MAEAIVSLAIERISDLLINEAVLQHGVPEEVERLKAELQRMQGFLINADRKQDQDELTCTLVRQIRDLAYEAEDVIDDFILQAAHEGGFRGFITKSTKRFRLRNIGEQVKAIQTKLEDISKNLPAYNRISGAEESSSVFAMQQRLRRTYSHVEEEDVVSLEGITNDVLDQLMTEEDRLHVVVSIVGMGGIGKTTLASKVYNHINVKRRFDCCAWAFISQQCRPAEVLQDLVIKLLPREQNDDKLVETQLVKKLYDGLKGKRYLIVFDDIWKSGDWDKFKPAFPKGKKGSKILFTTRHKNVAVHADRWSSPIELSFLTDDESWKLFKMKAFPGDACPEELEMLGREMVKKCGGLPLAIAVLGGLLATKKTRAEWEMVQRNINAYLNNFPLEDDYGKVNWILGLSYTELPFRLKPCFLYLGHYPEDWEISKKELIRLWIAEGFISPSWESRGMLMEEAAERFLEELINRCLVQVGRRDYTGTSVKTCRIHDLLRDLCMRKAEKENFLKIIQPSLMENDGHVNLTPSMARIIAVHPSKRYVSLKGHHPNLRSLLLFQNEKLIELNISKCNDFKFLRVLNILRKDVEPWYVNRRIRRADRRHVDPWHVPNEIGNLRHLRDLKLRSTGEVILPGSVGKLKNLHTLDIFILRSGIPHDLLKWRRLRHIRVSGGHTIKDVDLLESDSLENIHTLAYIESESLIQNNAVLELTNIRSLKIYFKRSTNVELIVKALIGSQHLRSLNIKFPNVMDPASVSFPDLEPLSRYDHLSKLSLAVVIREDPHLSHHVLNFLPANIVKLTLQYSRMKQDPMAVLGKLRLLRTLKLGAFSYTGTKMVCSANDFVQLDFLFIQQLDHLEEWQIEEGAMPRLRRLSLHFLCFGSFPEGLRYITTLQEMKLVRLKRSLLERIQVIDGREGEDFSKVRHIPSIQIEGEW